MEHQQTARILVAGTGPAGLIAALGFAAEGFPVTLVGPEATAPDGRTTALMNPALKVLDRLGVLEAVVSKAAPLKVMRIVDATSRLIRSPVVTFRASEIDEDEFGLNLPNSVLTPALASAVAARAGIDWLRSMVANWHLDAEHVRAGLADGSSVDASLAVAADGRLSPARQAAGISTSARSYPQAALVLNFGHSGDHAFTSTEFHTETGPFTQVPLPGNRSSLVWVVKPETATELAALDDATLSQRVEQQMQSMLGRVAVEPGRQIYPLSAVTPLRFARDRVALVGEAAHVFPPIGAQGLNLGIRDVDDLIGIACENRSDPGAAKALAAYDFKRRPDILARSSAVNLLN
ncbi:UbiH/UbiF family hydroxylase, partial [Mesorhizobium sp. M7A.F.Ca.CA.002.07.1.1]